MLFPITILLIAGGYTIDALLSSPKKLVLKFMGQAAVAILVGVAAMQGAWSFFGNGIRPLAGTGAVWNLSDDEIFMLSNGFEDRGAFMPMLQEINQCMKSSDPIAIALPYKFPLSLLFGDSYSRDVKMLNPPSGTPIDADYLKAGGFKGMVLHDDVKNAVVLDAEGLWSKSYGPYTLLRVPTVKQNCG